MPCSLIAATLKRFLAYDVAAVVAWVLPQAMRKNLTMAKTYLEFPDFVLEFVTRTPSWREAAATIKEPRCSNPAPQLIVYAYLNVVN
ncbi:hypothetical protein H9P43_008615 [Blastocladiella emersonii ATCC 22665]|nr:hypothetical protein H9P43_008615 [Blastocladiella emersonii ATCC 22665]